VVKRECNLNVKLTIVEHEL